MRRRGGAPPAIRCLFFVLFAAGIPALGTCPGNGLGVDTLVQLAYRVRQPVYPVAVLIPFLLHLLPQRLHGPMGPALAGLGFWQQAEYPGILDQPAERRHATVLVV